MRELGEISETWERGKGKYDKGQEGKGRLKRPCYHVSLLGQHLHNYDMLLIQHA